MTAALCFILGVCLTVAVLLMIAVCSDDDTQPSAQTQAWLEQLRAQQRITELTQETVAQMLKLARKQS